MANSLPPLCQLAFAVDDVRAAAQSHHVTFGSGPFFVVDHVALQTVSHRGAPAHFDHSSAYGQWGSVMVELIAVHSCQPTSLRNTMPTTGLHHSAHMVSDIDVAVASVGATIELDAVTASGLRFVMCTPADNQGHLIELYSPSQRLLQWYATVANAAIDWDGSDVVTTISSPGVVQASNR
jgi:hypothetical protein